MKRLVSPSAPLAPRCADCNAALRGDEVAITKKLVGRGVKSYCCTRCLSNRLGVGERVILAKIEEFREMGCALFSFKK